LFFCQQFFEISEIKNTLIAIPGYFPPITERRELTQTVGSLTHGRHLVLYWTPCRECFPRQEPPETFREVFCLYRKANTMLRMPKVTGALMLCFYLSNGNTIPNCFLISSICFIMVMVSLWGISSHSILPSSRAFLQAATSYSYPVICSGTRISFLTV